MAVEEEDVLHGVLGGMRPGDAAEVLERLGPIQRVAMSPRGKAGWGTGGRCCRSGFVVDGDQQSLTVGCKALGQPPAGDEVGAAFRMALAAELARRPICVAAGRGDEAEGIALGTANFSGLQSQICSGLAPGLFCVNDAIDTIKDWFYDAPKLNPLSYDGSWKSDPVGSDASGRRFWEITDQSYQIDFQGRFDEVLAKGWNGNLLDQNASKVSGETIPPSWKSTNGYNLPASASVFNFSKHYKVSKTRLEKGELGCPNGNTISHCTFVNAYIAAGVDLGGQVSARGDITQRAAGITESVIINAAILRNTKILINNKLQDTIATGIGNRVSELSVIEDGGLKPKDIKLNGKVKVEGKEKQVSFSGEGSVAADFIYEEDQEVASILAKYLEEASSNYFNTGTSELIRLTLNDSIGMTADIRGIGFTAADVFTEQRLQNPQSSAFTVFKVVEVPGPLPLLGLGTFIGYSRKLRSRLKSSKKTILISSSRSRA